MCQILSTRKLIKTEVAFTQIISIQYKINYLNYALFIGRKVGILATNKLGKTNSWKIHAILLTIHSKSHLFYTHKLINMLFIMH